LSPNTSPNPNLLSPRLNESTYRRSPTPNASIIEEADETNSDLDEGDTSRDSGPPEIKPVLGWRHVGEARMGSDLSEKNHEQYLGVGMLNGMVSHQGSLHDTYESGQGTKRASDMSSDSVYQEKDDSTGFAALGFASEENADVGPEDVEWGIVLRGVIGVGREELREIQGWLVAKARKEREALRVGVEDSPYVQVCPKSS
jgi:hypothetical protein